MAVRFAPTPSDFLVHEPDRDIFFRASAHLRFDKPKATPAIDAAICGEGVNIDAQRSSTQSVSGQVAHDAGMPSQANLRNRVANRMSGSIGQR